MHDFGAHRLSSKALMHIGQTLTNTTIRRTRRTKSTARQSLMLSSALWLMAISSASGQVVNPRKATATEPQSRWEVIYLGETRIGFGYESTETDTVNERLLLRTRQHLEMRFKRFGDIQTIQMDGTFEDWTDGTMRSFDLAFGDSPSRQTRIQGVVDGRLLRLETTIGTRKTRSVLNLPNEVRSPEYESLVLMNSIKRPGDRIRFQMFKPEMGKLVDTVITGQRRSRVSLHDGQVVDALEVLIGQSELPDVTVYVDKSGEVLRTDSDLFGKQLTTYRVDEKVAMESIAGAELDQAAASLISTDKIRRPHDSRKVIYEITVEGADPAKLFTTTDYQTLQSVNSNTVRLTVSTEPSSLAERTLNKTVSGSRSPGKEYSANCVLIQTDDYYVRDLARKAAAGRRDHEEVAIRCEAYVKSHIKNKNFSTALASAAEVAKSLEGDCTEHAVLLAGLLRVNGIPSRVVVGLVYTDHYGLPSFAGHMWTEAWVGNRWKPLDATLGAGRLGAAHIAIAHSHLAGESPVAASLFLPMFKLLGKTQIRVIEAKY